MTVRDIKHPAQSSQSVLIERLISWPLVEDRLMRFAAIARSFPLTLLLNCRSKPPYYCHYMAWRLGTWDDEQLFVRLEALLTNAECLPNWKCERPLLKGGEFADFWSLVWQLQVAEYLSGEAENVSWQLSGPDLSVEIGGRQLFVECYVYRKSFAIKLFVEEILAKLDSDFQVSHDMFMPLSLNGPHQSLTKELSEFLAPLLDEASLNLKRSQAQSRYPVLVSRWKESSLTISIAGQNPDAYDPSALPQNVGEPTAYMEVALREAAKAKDNKNSLDGHRPNLVAVNYALSAEAQLALTRLQADSHQLPLVNLGNTIESFAITTIGIDRVLSRDQLILVVANSCDHPARYITARAHAREAVQGHVTP